MKSNYTLYIHLKSNHKKHINEISNQIKKQAISFNFITTGPVILPATSKLYTVLRSPHVHKKSRDQFELKIIRRLFILTFNDEDAYSLKLFITCLYNLSPNVQIKLNYKKNYA